MRTSGLTAGLNLYLVERDSAGNLLQRGLVSDTGTNDWETRSQTFTSGPAAASAYFYSDIYSGSGTAWLDDVQMLEDLVLAAANEALRKSRDLVQQELGKLTGGLKIPGLGM